MFLKILIMITVVFLTGCDRINKVLYKDAFEENKVSTTAQDSGKTSVKNIAGENSDTVLRLFEGLIKINSTERSFKDCNNPDSLYYIKDETGALSANFKKIFPSENIYASAMASVKGYTSDSVKINARDPEKYYKVLIIKEVISVEGKNFRNTCIPYDFWCLGNEPNWSLQISESENLMELYLPSEKKSYFFFYNDPKEEDGMIKYFGYNNIQRTTLNVSVKKENCSDNMSDKTYEYSVTLALNDSKKFSGCAIKGNFIK